MIPINASITNPQLGLRHCSRYEGWALVQARIRAAAAAAAAVVLYVLCDAVDLQAHCISMNEHSKMAFRSAKNKRELPVLSSKFHVRARHTQTKTEPGN